MTPLDSCDDRARRQGGVEQDSFISTRRGPSARTLLRSATAALLTAIGLAVLGGLLLAFPAALIPLVVRLLSVGVLSSLGWACIGYVIGRLIGMREAGRGYTSLPNRYRELPQVNPRTGKVQRLAGQPYGRPYTHIR